jgi:hypothetical protein
MDLHLSAMLTARLFSYSITDAKLCFSVTIPQMAATLATAVVGYQTKNATGDRLLDAGFVNAALVLVVATCIAGPILTERWGKTLSVEKLLAGSETGNAGASARSAVEANA